jgi:hypothetical protein
VNGVPEDVTLISHFQTAIAIKKNYFQIIPEK